MSESTPQATDSSSDLPRSRNCSCSADFVECRTLIQTARETGLPPAMIEKFGSQIRAVIRRRLKDRSLREDVFHDAVIAWAESLSDWNSGECGLCWWVARLTSRVIARANYASKKRAREFSVVNGEPATVQSEQTDVTEQAEHCMKAVMDALDGERASVLQWRSDGMRTSEIAYRLRTSHRTVNRWLQGIRAEFRTCLERHGTDRGGNQV